MKEVKTLLIPLGVDLHTEWKRIKGKYSWRDVISRGIESIRTERE